MCEGTARPRDRGLEESRVVALMYTCIRLFKFNVCIV